MKLSDLFTRPTATEAQPMYLELPDGSISTEYYLEVISTESDAFRRAETTAKRKALEVSQLDGDDELADAQFEVEIQMLSSVVVGWNLDEIFSKEGVIQLLRESHGNKERLSRFSCNRSNFFQKKQDSSSTGSKNK